MGESKEVLDALGHFLMAVLKESGQLQKYIAETMAADNCQDTAVHVASLGMDNVQLENTPLENTPLENTQMENTQ
ncbi:hypothetical protein BGZ94_010036 [Podila epigama]|nr:hypothetical protein BGZ94_010036 [Podila epigama]